MRSLSERQAKQCENAKTPRCRCRCGGAFHGKGRLRMDAPRTDYEALDADDPHHVDPKKTKGGLRA